MTYENRFFFCIISLIILVVILGACMVLILTGAVDVEVECFGVDSSGRVYVGLPGKVEVYQDGEFQYTFNQNNDFRQYESKGSIFSVTEDDRIVMVTSGIVYYFDLEGKLLSSKADYLFTPSMRTQLQKNRKTVTSGEDTYELKHTLGRTCIVKNGDDVVYQISPFSTVVKIAMMIGLILFVPLVIFLIRDGIQWGKDEFLWD